MMGRTHYKVGILYYLLSSLLATMVFTFDLKIDLYTILAVILGSLLPDADESNSLINSKNPILKGTNKGIRFFNEVSKKIVGLIFFLLPAFGLFYISKNQSNPEYYWIAAGILLLLGFSGSRIGYRVPVLRQILILMDQVAVRIKKFFYILFFVLVGIMIIYFDHSTSGIIGGSVCILIAIFPHRTFLHSPEGFCLIGYSVRAFLIHVGYSYALIPFCIGYFSHLYLADIFTNSGVPVSVVPTILDKSGINCKGSKVYRLLSKRLRIPVMKTGSKKESIYMMLLLAVVTYIYYKF